LTSLNGGSSNGIGPVRSEVFSNDCSLSLGISDGEYQFFVLFSWALLSDVGLFSEVNPGELFILDVDGRGLWSAQAALKSTVIGSTSLVI
jgi:hypothetical protein